MNADRTLEIQSRAIDSGGQHSAGRGPLDSAKLGIMAESAVNKREADRGFRTLLPPATPVPESLLDYSQLRNSGQWPRSADPRSAGKAVLYLILRIDLSRCPKDSRAWSEENWNLIP